MFRNIRNTSRFRHNARPISNETLHSHFRAILRPRRRTSLFRRAAFCPAAKFPAPRRPHHHSFRPFSSRSHFSLHRVASSRVRSSYSQPTSSLRSKFDGQECVPSSSRDSSSFSRRRQRRALDLVFSFLFCFLLGAVHLRRSPHLIPSSEAVSIHPQLDPHLVSVIIKKATKNLLITVLINDVKKDQRKANKNQACYRHDSLAIKIEPNSQRCILHSDSATITLGERTES